MHKLKRLAAGEHVFSVTTGAINIFMKRSRDAAKYISKQKGFKAVFPSGEGHTLWFFDTLGNAKIARNRMRAEGIQCGRNICEFVIREDGGADFFDKAD